MTWYTNNSTRSTCSQEQVEAFSLTSYLDTIQSERAKLKNIHERSYSPDSETESCRSSQSGMTFALSTESLGGEKLTFFVEDSPARTSVRRVKEQELPESVRDFGRNMRDSLERCGLDLSLPKTHHCFELGDLELSSKTWPRWGIMLDGECSELGMSVRHISATECGSWPTPSANKTTASGDLVNVDGTPWDGESKPHSAKTGKPVQTALMDKIKYKCQLPNAVAYGGTQTQQKWGNPRCFMHKDALTDRGKGNLGEQVNEEHKMKKMGQLNPSWVEWLMAWPIGWTDLKPLATDKFRSVQHWHSVFSRKD